MKTDIRHRIQNVRKELKNRHLGGVIIIDPSNVRYISGFTGHDSWALITLRGIYLITDSRYTEQAQKQCTGIRIIQRTSSLAGAVSDIISRQSSITCIGIEDKCPLNTFRLIRKKLTAKVKPSGNIIENLRQIKDAHEISCVRKAGKIAMDALSETIKQFKRGITETEAAALLDYNISKRHSAPGFETIVAFGSNASQPHCQPGKTKLRKNDTILIDFGARYQGYTCDITRCFVFGKAERKYAEAYNAVLAAQKNAIEKVKAQVSIAEVERVSRAAIDDANLPQYGHGTGHGLGLDIHELPIVSEKNIKGKLCLGQVITIEPGVYIPGKLGIRIEDDILVTETGCEILTPQKFKNLTTIDQ